MRINKNIFFVIMIFFITAGLLFGVFFMGSMDMDEKRTEFISQKEAIIKKLMGQGKYACCLENPCVYCIEKTPGHGEGATCNCLEDVVTGKHPCGECIGEILEGHGNPFLALYFARAISDEVGEQHLDTLKEIISEKYQISIEEQL